MPSIKECKDRSVTTGICEKINSAKKDSESIAKNEMTMHGII